ncbi:MAG: fumarylacetoacetate hydrolase family protein [Sporomusaceae bacterium]|nr:fumarylacetoacetate hydrolase family protein [Sporomusaceae bacterium]
MRLATLRCDEQEEAAIRVGEGYILIREINKALGSAWETNLLELLTSGQFASLHAWHRGEGERLLAAMTDVVVDKKQARFAPLYRHPRKIWGIGLNYVEHAGDLAEKAPTHSPASFAKFDTTVIGPGDTISIPLQSERTTAEAELGIIFGKTCRDVAESDWLEAVAGFTTLIDMTAEDILALNPRYLTRSKNFDSFFSFGPELVTPDEIGDVAGLTVATVLNGAVHAQNVVANMTFPPAYLVSFHSQVATMLPGDIICTGTPRAVRIAHGDTAECRIDGFEPLQNPVIDRKLAAGSPKE